MVINSFKGPYSFLSNFCPTDFGSAEHFYQAAKTMIDSEQQYVLTAENPMDAKKRGKTVTLRPDWEDIKLEVMENILRMKFSNPHLRNRLLDTGDAELIEGNWWGDTYWGVCKGVGENHLGKLLMKLREEYRES